MKKILIFVVAYNANKSLTSLLDRIPEEVFSNEKYEVEVLVIDDCSQDQTLETCFMYQRDNQQIPIVILYNPVNLGYGGNQKLGYHYVLENGFDAVILLHGDGQYAPEEIPRLLRPILLGETEVVFGSRIMKGGTPIKNGMPLYKYLGNRFLTFVQNLLIGTSLSEYHSGYRLYSAKALAQIPFEQNSNGFDFDTDIIIQLHASGLTIQELSIPTFYGDEICYVNGVQYALRILQTSLLYAFQKFGIFYDPKFDLEQDNQHYQCKFDFLSSHSQALKQISAKDSVLILGCGPAPLVRPFADRATSVSTLDIAIDQETKSLSTECFVERLDEFDLTKYKNRNQCNCVLLLDVLEHLAQPEECLRKLRRASFSSDVRLVVSLPNVAFLPVRLMLLLGYFNYGKRGILDRTHTRLFTLASARRLFEQEGFETETITGIPAPFPLAVDNSTLGRLLLKLNQLMIAIPFMKGLFSYQIFLIARPRPILENLMSASVKATQTHKFNWENNL